MAILLSLLNFLMLLGVIYLVMNLHQHVLDIKDHIHALHHDLDTKNKQNGEEN
jgi:hypothetical protein